MLREWFPIALVCFSSIGLAHAQRADQQVVRAAADRQGFSQAVVEIEVPHPSFLTAENSHKSIQLPGFGAALGRPGTPDLPSKTYWVAIPPGATPVLTVLDAPESLIPGVRPRPFPTEDVRSEDQSDELALGPKVRRSHRSLEDDVIYRGARLYPDAVVRLGEIGVFRDQRYVEVIVTPVRFDPRAGGVRFASRIKLEVRFEGDDGRRTSATRDARFEDVYRRAFVNYAQGTTFRIETAPETRESASPAAPTAGPLYRIKIRQNGVVRLDFTRMTGTGFTTQPISTWKLTNRGLEVPLHVNDVNANDLLDSGDWVQFYGQALDDEPKALLHTSMPDGRDLFTANDFTDENVYFLTTEVGPRSRMATRVGDPVVRTPPTDFEAIAHVETDDAFRPLGGVDPWFWFPTLSNPGTVPNPASRPPDIVPLPGLASGTLPAHVTVRVRGSSEDANIFPDHLSRVTLTTSADALLATNNDDGTFDGRSIYTHSFDWTYPGSGPGLTNPAKVVLEVLPVSPGYSNQAILDWIEIKYRRSFVAAGDTLTFAWPDGDAQFDITGFVAGALPVVYEITGRVSGSGVVDAVRVTGATAPSSGAIRFRMDNDPAITDGTLRRFVVTGATAISVPATPDFQPDTVSSLKDNLTQADLIVMAHPNVLDNPAACSSASLTALLNLRASEGISSKVACIQDVYDEFNDGLPGPVAIKKFLTWVSSTTPGQGWANPKPSFVLLLGDGSFDYKGGTTNGNYVPTQIVFRDEVELGYYASDSLMAAIAGSDSMPELTVGRIPARNVTEANAALDKIRNYDSATPAGNWTRNVVFVSDRGKRDNGVINVTESLMFEQVNDDAEAWMKRPPHTDTKLRYFSDYCMNNVCNQPQMTIAIKNAVNAGAAVMQFEGHSNFNVWSDDRILDQGDTRFDLDDLHNGLMAPWLAAHNCLTGGFHTTALRVMGQDWVTKGDGGAVGVFSPSGLSLGTIGAEVSNVLFGDLYGPAKLRTTDTIVLDSLAFLCGNGAIISCQNYVLLGDPTTRLELPTVQPPTNVSATGGNQVVNLAWTASATAGATYDVYRTTDLIVPNYVKANASPIAGTAFADTGRTNAVTYYYAVVAVDPTGFESRWSHRNTDCGAPGPTDCLSATPLNPNPPAVPTGITVTDTETGGTLDVSWTANGEVDLLSYTVWWDDRPYSVSTPYRNSRNTNKSTSTKLTGLANNTTYYIAVTATNTSGQTSNYSTEVQGIPHLVQGVRSPQFIRSLHVDKSGSDALLTWNAVTLDIYNKATTISKYEVYRGTSPTFVPDVTTLIGSPTSTTFTDVGALGGATPSYYYLVRAVDSSNNGGGLGEQLPNGIFLLTVARSATPGNVVLSWPPVTTNFDGGPVRLGFYQVYASGSKFRRSDIRDGQTPPGPPVTTTSGTSVELTPGPGIQYYSVLVVDAKGNVSPF